MGKSKHEKESYLGYWVRAFLCTYLTNIRNLSGNTMRAYRDAIKQLVSFVCKDRHIRAEEILVTDITSKVATSFLNDIEISRKCSIKTRNLRLSAIIALAKYIASNSPEHIEWCREIRNIPVKKAPRTQITYLEKFEMDALLNTPAKNTEQGWRDYVLLLFLYNTGARAEEAASLKIGDVYLPKGKGLAVVSILGKGGKARRCPLWDDTCKALRGIIADRFSEEHVFLNRQHLPMSRFGVYEMVTRHADTLSKVMPSIKGKRVTPHTIRHTTATHLLQAGVDINTIRAWLGHVSVETTNIYAEVNMEMKAKALKSCEVKSEKTNYRWKDDKNLMDFLDSLK